MVVAYDGAPFHGFAENAGVLTVASALRRAIELVMGHPVELAAAGRTDRGVHARGQVVSFDVDAARFDPSRLQRAINALCRPSIVVREIAAASPDFHARFSAKSRVYRYYIHNAPYPDPLTSAYRWHVALPINLAAVRNASIPLVGTHDFGAFCKRPEGLRSDGSPHSFVRKVQRLDWSGSGEEVRLEIEAGSFCRQMVRSIVGTLVDVGIGRRRANDVAALLCSGARTASVAPPHGLVLWEVRY
jgi:tRNA pseudouridine38-40 synthase